MFQGSAALKALSLSWLMPQQVPDPQRALVTWGCCPDDLSHKHFPQLSVLSHLQVSITFDPFLYLPVPLPQKQKVLTVYYFAKEPHKKPIKVKDTFYSGKIS